MIVIEPPSSGSGHPAFKVLRKPELLSFLKKAQRALKLRGDVTLLLTDDARIRELNRSFRGKNKSTDVLSFPAGENAEGVVGDLAISVPIAAAQAEAYGHTLVVELQILTLHGLLHLAGMDHETDAGEMRALEAELREALSLPASLIERTIAPKRKPIAAKAVSGGAVERPVVDASSLQGTPPDKAKRSPRVVKAAGKRS